MAIIMDGKALAAKVLAQAAEDAAKLPRRPCLAAVLVGENPASVIYVRNKESDCKKTGIESRKVALPATISEQELLREIATLNGDPAVDGILVQMPLPAHISEAAIKAAIAPEKDVDAFHPFNVGRIVTGDPMFVPCTPAGVMEFFKEYGICIEGKQCVVVGRSNIVGKPMGLLLLQANGTVVYTHSHTQNLGEITRQADILVVAAGSRGLITGDMVKPGAAVVDVGMNRDTVQNCWFGDVCFDEVSRVAGYITPVPGGVGPMTRAMLIKNIVTAAKARQRAE